VDKLNNPKVLPYAASPVSPAYRRRQLRLRIAMGVAVVGFAGAVAAMRLLSWRREMLALSVVGFVMFLTGTVYYFVELAVGFWKEGLK
jgi:hypothetical protein